MNNKTGGPAFPQSGVCTPEINSWDSDDFGGRGISMRDYFAAKAMQSALLTSKPENPLGRMDIFAQSVAKISYEMADAMLRAREAS
ncbi:MULTISPECIES: hypothetical protein [Enterobacter cloacae complex]|uniref:hypothetical protein n=1 Tax=Enterobacter cloacae complex TaxID=354276 RepID=UPI0007C4A592|nr:MULTISPECIES: hypothetical protein [Enterobacter cloacae complex]MBE4892106.1 hypothetical protein [Enterobacter cloacae complex sp. P16RS2]